MREPKGWLPATMSEMAMKSETASLAEGVKAVTGGDDRRVAIRAVGSDICEEQRVEGWR